MCVSGSQKRIKTSETFFVGIVFVRSFVRSSSEMCNRKCIHSSKRDAIKRTSRAFNFILLLRLLSGLIRRNLFNAQNCALILIEILNFGVHAKHQRQSVPNGNAYFHVCISIIFVVFHFLSVRFSKNFQIFSLHAIMRKIFQTERYTLSV